MPLIYVVAEIVRVEKFNSVTGAKKVASSHLSYTVGQALAVKNGLAVHFNHLLYFRH